MKETGRAPRLAANAACYAVNHAWHMLWPLLIAKKCVRLLTGVEQRQHLRVRVRPGMTRSKVCVFQSAPPWACAVVSSEPACQHPKSD